MDFRKLKSSFMVGFLVLGVGLLGIAEGSASGTAKVTGVDKALTESVGEDLLKNQITLNSSKEELAEEFDSVKADAMDQLVAEYEQEKIQQAKEKRLIEAREKEERDRLKAEKLAKKKAQLKAKEAEERRKRIEAEKLEKKRVELEKKRLEAERVARIEAERKEAERREVAREEAERQAKLEDERRAEEKREVSAGSGQEDLAQGSKKYYMEATAYTASCNGCSGITAMGIDVRNTTTYNGYGIIAVDTSVIPLGTIVSINGRKYIAGDTGGAIKGNKIDVLVGSVNEATQFGRKHGLEVIVLGK